MKLDIIALALAGFFLACSWAAAHAASAVGYSFVGLWHAIISLLCLGAAMLLTAVTVDRWAAEQED